MFYNNKDLIPFLIKIQKISTNANYNQIIFFFLINKFLIFNNSYFFSFNNFFNNKTNSTKSTKIKIFKNKYFFNKIKKLNKIYFKNNKYSFKTLFKFTKFLKFVLFLNKIKINKYILNNSNLTPTFFYKNKKKFFKNWNLLIGAFLSPYHWNPYSSKKLIKNLATTIFIKNNLYFNKPKKLSKNLLSLNNKNKKIFINNYFYLKKFNLNFNNFNFLFKLQFNNPFKKNYNWFFSRPYLLLNNYDLNKSTQKYPNSLTIHFYKKCSKFFNLIKKFNFNLKLKKTNHFLFKNFNFNLNTINKTQTSKIFTVSKPSLNNFSFFIFKNNFYNINLFNVDLSNVKKLLKFKWIFNIKLRKTKISKKIKFFYNLKFNKFLNKISKINLFFNNILTLRFPKKIKKAAIWYNSKKFHFNINTNIKLIWFKKNFNCLIGTKEINIYNKINLFVFNKYNFFSNINKFKKLINIITVKNSQIIKRLKRVYFYSKEKNNFITSRYGFFFLTDNFKNYYNNFKILYNLKKLMYSFPYKNEIQRFILKKYTRVNFLTHFYNSNLNLNTNNFISFDKNNNPTATSNNFNYFTFDTFFKNKTNINFLLNEDFFYSKNWTYFHDQINFSKIPQSDSFDFIIKRVRFKPGYMSLWREVRTSLKSSLSLKFKYQYKLTNYLSKYNKFINFKTYLFSEMTLLNLLIRTRLLPNDSLCSLFIKNNMIFLNGLSCSNQHLQTFVGDFIQLIVSLKYYILYKWFINLSLKKRIRLKNISKKKFLPIYDTGEKKKSTLLPKHILFNKTLILDIAKYVEVDYFTLSAMILYEPFLWSDINIYNLIDQRFGIINLYNWKYIN